jgi:diguanylate cyclase (GGDEF)-like protein
MKEMQKVLIIDDSPLSATVLKDILIDEYEVFTSYSGIEGYDMAVDINPDIILLDIVMPDINGYEICKKLKKNVLTSGIPVIFISSLDEMEDEMKGLKLGAIDYITKPFRNPIVKIRIRNHLELKKTHDTLDHLSMYDPVTDLYNRRYFNEIAQKKWKMAVAEEMSVSIILIDIDQFEVYNGDYGHVMGDECLKTIANCIKNSMRDENDIVAVLGAYRFICFLTKMDNNEAIDLGNKIRNNIHDKGIPFKYSPISNIVTVSGSVGTTIPKEDMLIIDLIRKLDRLLAEIRREGGNRFRFLNYE